MESERSLGRERLALSSHPPEPDRGLLTGRPLDREWEREQERERERSVGVLDVDLVPRWEEKGLFPSGPPAASESVDPSASCA